MSKRVFFAAFALACSTLAPAFAEDQKPPSKPESRTAKHEEAHGARAPAVTSKGFGSWALRCEETHAEGEKKLCEISQMVETAAKQPVAKISVGRRNPTDPLTIVVILPTNVSFPSTVHIRTEKEDKWGLELQWQRCIPGACTASAQMNPATVAHWSSLNTQGDVVFTDAAGDEVELPMNLHGFGDAYNAFNK
jgi:invasion protein IalB